MTPPPSPDWNLYVALAALLVSIAFNVWQALDRRRERRPDVSVEVGHLASGPGLDDGGSHEDNMVVFLMGEVHVGGTVTITAAGMAPPRGRRRWAEMPAEVHLRGKEIDDKGRLPRVVTDDVLVVRVEHVRPLPPGHTQDEGARLWVRTSSGHRFVSSTALAPLSERYRGPSA